MRPAFSRLPGYSVFFLVILLFTSCSDNKSETIRKTALFNSEWRFILDDGFLCDPLEDDENWRILNLPHDWSIEGTFDEENPATFSGGALPGGIGWYRKHFFMPESDSAKRTFITFDGVYRNSKVFLNGVLLGTRPNGYISFTYDLTPFLRYGEKENVIAVRVDNSEQPNSRWYSGSGIYRNVWLTTVSRTRIAFNETFVSTPEVGDDKATIQVQSQLVVEDNTAELLEAVLTISDPKGKKVAGDKLRFNPDQGSRLAIDQSLIVADPVRWSVADPSLYTLEIMLYADGKKIDSESVRFGIRTFHFDPEKGFFLNNVPMKILGVCNHHDLGSLGAAVNIRYLERQLELLKDMGCNAIRTSHNPPAPELLDLCDEMGFLVIGAALDMW